MEIQKIIKKTLKEIKINKKEKILVCVSGGKDSAVVLYFLKKFGYNVFGFHINLGLGEYSQKCEDAVKNLCEELKVNLKIYDFKKEHGSSMCFVRSQIQNKKSLKNCAICGVIKKWIINKEARKLKADLVATGHHLDDEAQTFFLNVLKGALNLSSNTGPITKNTLNKKFISRIKPLFFVLEKEIKKFALEKKLPVVYESCPCAIDSYRIQVRKFFKNLSDKEKRNILENFIKISPKIKKQEKEMKYCEICGEPSRKNICKKCELMKINL